jgi:two-component system response regulator YesN
MLRRLLNQMAAADFVELSLSDLAPKLCCSPRHLSRLFRAEVGASFREKQTELRLVKACDLLANSDDKVVEVALTSGYQSNSLFNLLFKKRFGISPGKWREQHAQTGSARRKNDRWLPV